MIFGWPVFRSLSPKICEGISDLRRALNRVNVLTRGFAAVLQVNK